MTVKEIRAGETDPFSPALSLQSTEKHMAGFISSPFVEAPKDAWWRWRASIVLADNPKLADQHLQNILDDPKAPEGLKKMVVARREKQLLEASRPTAPVVGSTDDDLIPF
jgi:hypothetical protein